MFQLSEKKTGVICEGCRSEVMQKTIKGFEIEKTFTECACVKKDDFEENDRAARRLKRLENSGLPGRLMSEGMTDWQPRPGLEAPHAWFTSWKNNLESNIRQKKSYILAGSYGTGKTKMSCDIFRASILNSDLYGYYINATDLKFKFSAWKWNREEMDAGLDRLIRADILFIDDLGQAQLKDSDADLFYFIINGRMDAGRPVYLTTHCNAEELASVIGAEVVSRILGMCAENVVKFNAPDFRVKK
jgi:DNA replication protein DnaC